MIVEEIRLENLKILIEEFGSQAEVARLSGLPASYLSQIINRVLSKTGKPRDLGSDAARDLERGCNKERGWLDHTHTTDRQKRLHDEMYAKLTDAQRAQLLQIGDTFIKPEDEDNPKHATQ